MKSSRSFNSVSDSFGMIPCSKEHFVRPHLDTFKGPSLKVGKKGEKKRKYQNKINAVETAFQISIPIPQSLQKES